MRQKIMPTPSSAYGVSSMPVDLSSSSRGTLVIRPTPSLDAPSAATAPRCSSRDECGHRVLENFVACVGQRGTDEADAAGILIEAGVD